MCSFCCSFPSTLTTAPQETCLLNSRSLQAVIWDSDNSSYRQKVEQLVLWCHQRRLNLNTLRFKEKPTRTPITVINNTISSVSGNHYLLGSKVDFEHILRYEDVFPASAQEVQPASTAADPLIPCKHPSSSGLGRSLNRTRVDCNCELACRPAEF